MIKKLRKERKKHIWKPAAQVTSVYNRPEENPTPSQGSNPAWCQILTIRGHQGTQLGPTCIATLGSKNQGNKNLSMDFLPPSKLDMQRYLMFCCSQEFLGGSCVFFSKTFSPKKILILKMYRNDHVWTCQLYYFFRAREVKSSCLILHFSCVKID